MTHARTVDWWSVHQFVTPLLVEVKSWPMAGTLTWQHLDDTDPRKWASLLDAAQHWTLRVDTCQQHLAEASRDIAGASDWPKIARNALQRNGVYIPREVA